MGIFRSCRRLSVSWSKVNVKKMSEELLLKWNDHHNLFFVGAEELCGEEEYTDVTLAAGDKFFQAHKLVLSICSPYFRQLFKHLGKDKPVIFLKDVNHNHLHLLLQYMYQGEIKVQEKELVHVLSAAQALEIKGLCEQGSQNQLLNLKNPSNIDPPFKKGVPKKQEEIPESQDIHSMNTKPAEETFSESEPGHEQLPVKKEVQVESGDFDQAKGDGVEDVDAVYSGGSFAGLGLHMAYDDSSVVAEYGDSEHYGVAMSDIDVGWTTSRKSSKAGNVVCNYCGKEYRHLSALKTHLPVHTKEKRFECKGCGRRFTQISSLNKHIKTKNCWEGFGS